MEKINLKEIIKENEENRKEILPVMYSYKEKRESVLNEEEKKELQEKLRKIKEESLEKIFDLKKIAIENLEKNGIKVIEAKDANEANKKINEIIGKEKLIIKSKSNTANEINLKEGLKGKEIVETDLGDFVVQLFSGEDLHPVLPALNYTPKEISQKIKSKFKKNVKATPEDILQFVREHLREKILKAKVGITGANVIGSEGSIFILENEGNISLASRIPEKHIIISSFDKIVSSREDAFEIVRAAGIFGTGQEYPVYVNVISGPSKTADIQNKLITGAQGAKEVYLILLDNKRTEILKSEFKEILYCINCGACLNFCPVYHQIFSKYGSGYFAGSKGVICSYLRDSKKDAYKNGAFFCTTCKQCSENCPVKIDLPEMMRKVREGLVKEGIEPESAKEMIDNFRKFGNPFGNPNKERQCNKLYCC